MLKQMTHVIKGMKDTNKLVLLLVEVAHRLAVVTTPKLTSSVLRALAEEIDQADQLAREAARRHVDAN